MNIKDKVNQLRSRVFGVFGDITERYPNTKSLSVHIPLFIFSIFYMMIPFMVEDFGTKDFIAFFICSPPAFISLVYYILYSYDVVVYKKKNLLTYYLDERKIEEDLIQLFGSIENSFKAYDELMILGSNLTDKEFRNFMSLSLKTKDKRSDLREVMENKLDKLDERIEKLRKEKKDIRDRFNNKELILVNKNILEAPKNEDSMDLSELKERVLV